MDSSKIAHLIKEIRRKDGLTQAEFAQKYGVTYQAVSKWENGKNIPDIAILKQICQDYNLNLEEFFNGIIPKKKKKFYFYEVLVVVVLFLFFLFFYFYHKDNSFQLKTLTASCKDFTLYGSIAYNTNQTAIRISDITYCGENESAVYKKLTCRLYEKDDKTKIEIASYSSDENTPISLTDFLKNVEFHIDHFSKSCKMYQENALQVDIEALKENGETIYYQIPLSLNDHCEG